MGAAAELAAVGRGDGRSAAGVDPAVHGVHADLSVAVDCGRYRGLHDVADEWPGQARTVDHPRPPRDGAAVLRLPARWPLWLGGPVRGPFRCDSLAGNRTETVLALGH